MPTYKKWLIGIAFVVCLCVMSYSLGYIAGRSEGIHQKQEAAVTQEAPAPSSSYLISADLFIPNFNVNLNSFYVVDYRPVQADYIEFGSTSKNLIIVGKGDPARLQFISITFPKNNMQAYNEALEGIQAVILALSPSTGNVDCKSIMTQLGLFDNVNNAEGMKISDHHDIRYSIHYYDNSIDFIAFPVPAN